MGWHDDDRLIATRNGDFPLRLHISNSSDNSRVKLVCVPLLISSEDGKTVWRCGRCGFTATDKWGHFPDKIIRTCEVQRRGLGDFIGLALTKLGITKQRWAKWTGKPLSEQKLGCRLCHSREQQLNQFGWEWQYRVNRVGDWVLLRASWIKDAATKGIFQCTNRDS